MFNVRIYIKEYQMSILNSGGAEGADAEFGKQAKLIGHEVRHYVFRGMKSECDDLVVLNANELKEADEYLKWANIKLKRKFPTQSTYVDNLLRRNFHQIKDTYVVYAVAPLKNKMVEGGTAWGVELAKIRNVSIIYLFNLNENKWNQWSYAANCWDYILEIDMFKPNVFSVYTGIGSRKLTQKGEDAIRQLFKGT